MNRDNIAEVIADERGLVKAPVKRIVKDVFDLIIEELKAGRRIDIAGFGSFVVKDTAPRKGVNPQTSQPVDIPASHKVAFKVSKPLRDAIRGV